MPWHFGGERVLTDAEIDSYLKHYRDKQQKEADEAKKASRQRTPPRRSSRR